MLRTLLDEGLIVGSDVIQLGMHGFVGSRDERNFARAQGMTVMTAAEMQRRGVGTAMIEALRRVPGMIGAIYVTVNVNVVDLPYAPVAPDAQWGGLGAADLLEAVYILGQDRRVQAFDLVGVDAYRDHLDVTVRLACTIILSFLSGINARTER
jgi:formiminoglutamase